MNKRWKTVREKPELLIPAKDLEVLRTAVRFGADAVYIGGEAFSLRAKARNFSPEDMREGIAFAHARGVQVHVAANIYAHNRDLEEAARYFAFLQEIGPDAVLVADPGMFSLAKKHCPQIPVHISTQANNTNYETFRFWHSLGAARVVCARELSLREIAQIRERTPADLEIEAFIHGAMCISYSGRCLLSAWFTGRDANRGACTHPCRWKYSVMEESRPGEYFPVEETERGTYIFNSRDLCMIGHLPELAGAGIDSLKIEGRMKTALYVASITRAYRRAIDDYLESDEKYAAGMDWYLREIRKCTYRDFTTGFYFGRPDTQSMVYTDNVYASDAVFLGIVEAAGAVPAGAGFAEALRQDPAGAAPAEVLRRSPAITDPAGTEPAGAAAMPRYFAVIHQKNKFSVGDRVEIMRPDGRDTQTRVLGMWNAEGEPVQSAPHPGELICLRLGAQAEEGDILRTAPAAD
ncbi:MAG: U32 family peptidase [Eubacteriales bacterium]|nr:U32 family peptidase [Eubacteriales bacterium]